MTLRSPPVWLIILLLGSILIAALATLKPEPEPTAKPPASQAEVKVVVAANSTHRLTVTTQGLVTPRREVQLVAQVSGQVVNLAPSFVDGGFVQPGEVLLQLEPRDYQLAIIQAQAQLAEAQQALAQEQGSVRQAKREWRDLGDAQANALFLREPQLAAAKARLQSAQADVEQAELNLQRTKITAPFPGRIRETLTNLGQHLSPGSPVVTLYDTEIAEVRLPLSNQQAELVRLPLGKQPQEPIPVTFTANIAGETHHWDGAITRTEASVDTRTRVYYAIAEVSKPFHVTPEQPQPMMAGLFVTADIHGQPLQRVLKLPRTAL